MTSGFILTYLGGVIIQAIANVFVYTPAIIIALYIYERFIKSNGKGDLQSVKF